MFWNFMYKVISIMHQYFQFLAHKVPFGRNIVFWSKMLGQRSPLSANIVQFRLNNANLAENNCFSQISVLAKCSAFQMKLLRFRYFGQKSVSVAKMKCKHCWNLPVLVVDKMLSSYFPQGLTFSGVFVCNYA